MKYELTENKIYAHGKALYQIKALVSFGNVEAGELGGYIEKESNLSQSGNAWVYGDAMVYGDARVYGNAEIFKSTHYLVIGAIGSRNDFTTFFRTKTKEIFVKCGCFKGNIDEFKEAVTKTHGENKHAKMYLLAIELAKAQIELESEE